MNRGVYAPERMPLGSDYAGQSCSLARTLEVVGERWTLLIVRDLFFGVRRFSDLQRHLDIPRAVLSARIAALVDDGLVERRPYRPGRDELLLTERGVELWPAVHALMQWGERHHSPAGPRRVFVHLECGTETGAAGECAACGRVPAPSELEMRPGPGAGPPRRDDAVTVALGQPRRLLAELPLRTS
jgi:DNA-binding HxlR family transcriptional regulator